jgi:hypothetical protein
VTPITKIAAEMDLSPPAWTIDQTDTIPGGHAFEVMVCQRGGEDLRFLRYSQRARLIKVPPVP